MGAAYHTTQFLRALTGKPMSEDIALVSVYLPPSLEQIFHQMNRADQVHSLRSGRPSPGVGS